MITYPTNQLQKVLLAGKCQQGVLPDGYTQVEYLESSGTQWINTQTVARTVEYIKAKIMGTDNTSGNTWQTFIGCSATNSNQRCLFAWADVSGRKHFGYKWHMTGSPTETNINFLLNTEYTLEVDGNTIWFNGNRIEVSGSNENSDRALYLFSQGVNSNVFRGRFYYAQLGSDKDTLVRNLIPARRNSDNVLGMFDTVTGDFLTNQGTGEFIAGADVVPTPDEPIDIVCNNGVLKVNRNLYSTEYHNRALSKSDGVTTIDNNTVNVSTMVNCTNVKSFIVASAEGETLNRGYRVFQYRPDGTFIDAQTIVKFGQVLEIPSDCGYFRIQYVYTDIGENVLIYDSAHNFGIYADGTVEQVTDNLGNTANAEMLLGVGDYKDVQSVLDGKVARRIGVKVLDGTENWDKGTSFYTPQNIVSDALQAIYSVFCTHYQGVSTNTVSVGDSNTCRIGYNASGRIYIYADRSLYATGQDFANYLAQQYAQGTPVIIVYPLATPTTEQVTPQPLAGNSVTQTAGSIDNLPIESSTIAELKKRYIGSQEVKKVYIGDNLVWEND